MTPAGDTIRVLLIEDDPDDADLFAHMIAGWWLHRFDLRVAGDLAAAADLLRLETFDVVVSDLGLGPHQGMDTLLAVRELCGALPLVVLTGLDEASIGLRAIDIGAQAYLEKGEISGRQAAQTLLHAIQRGETLAALEEARRKAEATQAARTRFFATLSHELRQPLNGILGYLQLLELEPEVDYRSRRKYYGAVRGSAEHMLGLINDILDYAKVEAGELTLDRVPHDLARVLEEALTTLAPSAQQRKVRIELQPATNLSDRMVQADPRRLTQVAINLLSNAVRFSPEGGTVRLTTTCGNGMRGFAVADQGPGMDAAGIAVALEPFGQVHRNGGTGLGLPFCQRIVELHQGRMIIDSTPGAGTSIQVLIPAAGATAGATAPPGAEAAAPRPIGT